MRRFLRNTSADALRRLSPEPVGLRRIFPANASEDLLADPRYHIYDLHSAILPHDRQVIVYLPPQYASEPGRRFPVFYLHDAQNLFDGKTSYVANCTWRAHTTADQSHREGLSEPVILVGVAHTGVHRMEEYTPSRDTRMGGGKGPLYGRLLIEELKPFVDQTYRTLPEAHHTALGGSSLGGLISLDLALAFPSVFGKVAVLSPSLWWDQRRLLQQIELRRPAPTVRIWLDMGTAEGQHHLADTDLLHQLLLALGWRDGADLQYVRVDGAAHDESAWASRFGDVLRFLFPPVASPHA